MSTEQQFFCTARPRLDPLAAPPAPTTFSAAVLPWYSDQLAVAAAARDYAPVADDGPLGINIQCPRDIVEDYVGLICREAELVRALLPAPHAVTSLWLRGSPSRQFSPEAVTELIFRLHSRFPLAAHGAVRGVELSAPALTAERLALLAGLGFNRISLRVDATLGSDARRLARLDAMQRQLADFAALTVDYEVLFGSRSHTRYLTRLLAAMRAFPAVSIALRDAHQEIPQTLADRRETGRLLATAVAEMTAAGWRAFGNHLYVSPESSLALARDRAVLRLTPWGSQPTGPLLWLGLGVGAFGYRHPGYYRNTPVAAEYHDALGRGQLPDKVLYRVPAAAAAGLEIAQSLLCRHAVARPVARAFCEPLLAAGLLEATADRYQLTPAGVRQLAAILHFLRQPSLWGDDHAPVEAHASDNE